MKTEFEADLSEAFARGAAAVPVAAASACGLWTIDRGSGGCGRR